MDGSKLDGAVFYVSTKINGETKYIEQYCNICNEPQQITKDNGMQCCTSGTYTIQQIATPEHYRMPPKDITYTFTTTYNGTEYSDMTATVTGGVQWGDYQTTVTPVPFQNSMQIANVKDTPLPLTGMVGTLSIIVFSAAVALLGVIGLRKSRKINK